MIGCNCKTCRSTNPKDKRTRCSIYIEHNHKKILIDVGPDFRQQALDNQISDLDFVLITHGHNDHIIGLDDLRPINFIHKKDIPILAEEKVLIELKEKFSYGFSGNAYGSPKFIAQAIAPGPNSFMGVDFTALRIGHGPLDILGFRIENFAYITDAKLISPEQQKLLFDLDVLIINALREEKHFKHLTLHEAQELIKKLKPKKSYLTHMSHKIGLHENLANRLESGIEPAFDGLHFEL